MVFKHLINIAVADKIPDSDLKQKIKTKSVNINQWRKINENIFNMHFFVDYLKIFK